VAVEGGWQRKFDEPIETPDGAQLTTLREAVAYLAKTVPSQNAICRRSRRQRSSQGQREMNFSRRSGKSTLPRMSMSG
jgi:hypothetical protein